MIRGPSARRFARQLVAVTAVALAFPSMAVAAPGDSVEGFLFGSNPPFSVDIDVRGGPSGQAPTGSFTFNVFTFSQSEAFVSTLITCLAVNGSTAVVGGFGDLELSGAGPTGPVVERRTTGFVAVINDNGEPPPPPPEQPFPNDTVDDFGHRYVTTPDCGSPGFTPGRFLLIGDFVVVDAPAVPASKDECKDGGWKRYGDRFENQGRCVAFVQRGPKP